MDIKRLKLSEDSSIKEALELIGSERVRLGVVLSKDDKFLGIISDSNIRKALVNGFKIDDSIKEIYTKNPLTISLKTSKKKLLELSAKTDIYDFPVLDDEGRLVEIRSIASILNQKHKNKVILMAGGLGTRLAPLTKKTPKPMLKVGKKPILETIINRFLNQGFEDFILCVNYKRKLIEDYFKDGKDFSANISYIRERKKLGTAGALSLLKQDFKDSFIVMNADILTDLDFSELLKAHKKSKALMSVCLREFSQQIPYGVIELNKGFVSDIKEKPEQKFLVSAGIYVLEKEVLSFLDKNEYLDMPSLIQKLVSLDSKNVFSYLVNEYWIDIGRLSEYKKANEDFVL